MDNTTRKELVAEIARGKRNESLEIRTRNITCCNGQLKKVRIGCGKIAKRKSEFGVRDMPFRSGKYRVAGDGCAKVVENN